MKSITEHIRAHILGDDFSYETLIRSEWSAVFEKLMRNRLIMGAFRYGKLNATDKKEWNRLDRILSDVQRYIETGNTEILVDIANHALLEFEEGSHPLKHFSASDDGDHHVKEKI